MPIAGIASYLPTMNAVAAHWGQLETALNTPITLADGMEREAFCALIDRVANALAEARDATEAFQKATEHCDQAKSAFLPRLANFTRVARVVFAKTPYGQGLPRVPSTTATETQLRLTFDTVVERWARVNTFGNRVVVPTFTAPLLLPPDDYSLAQLQAEATRFWNVFPPVAEAQANLAQALEARTALLEEVRARVTDYRRIAREQLANVPKDSPLHTSLPEVTAPTETAPPLPDVEAWWSHDEAVALFSIRPIADAPDGLYHEVRYAPGQAAYKAKDEIVLATLPPGVWSFQTRFGLAMPGSVAQFRVYAITPEGVEKPAAASKIARTVPPTDE